MVNLVKLLEAGFSGLSVILLVLAYRLLRNEQRKAVPRARMMWMIVIFMVFALILALMNLIEAAGLIAGEAGSEETR